MRDENDVATNGRGDAMRMTTDIVASFVSNNKLSADELGDLIRTVHKTLASLSGTEAHVSAERPKPAVPINKSIQHDHIVCLEDGKKLKMLKRYLRSTYNLSPDDYRRRWGLPADYPMVAPAYAARRSEFAKSIGLGKGVRRKD
ncbi:MucR family transcriptional regulator [Vitreimonas sp.]|jgi:predicted transcriptional regulator|uniref:MucR family transcriptional regulator n=1 Tax=Vitreimonas sp. TaxID=3069702 RepID=UPI002ED7E5EB